MFPKKQAGKLLVFVALFAVLVLSFKWYRDNYVSIGTPYAWLPDATKVGNVEASMKQTRALVEALRANEWSPRGIPSDLKILPDAQYAEEDASREKGVSSFTFPTLITEEDSPVKDNIATYTSIYTRTTPKNFKGDRSTFAPSGFYIVGWKDGRVTQVPVANARFVKYGRNNYYTAVFPGMKAWKEDGMRSMYIEFAKGSDAARKEAIEFYRPHRQDDCPTCKKPKST